MRVDQPEVTAVVYMYNSSIGAKTIQHRTALLSDLHDEYQC